MGVGGYRQAGVSPLPGPSSQGGREAADAGVVLKEVTGA